MIGFSTLVALFFIGLTYWSIWENSQIQEPTREIVKRVLDGRFLVMDGYFYPENCGYKKLVDEEDFDWIEYTVVDTENQLVAWVYHYGMHNYATVEGDFDWMNQYECDSLYSAAAGISNIRKNNYKEACDIEKEARDSRKREEHKEVYKIV